MELENWGLDILLASKALWCEFCQNYQIMKNPTNDQNRLFGLAMQVSDLWEHSEYFGEEKYQEMCEVDHNVIFGVFGQNMILTSWKQSLMVLKEAFNLKWSLKRHLT